MLIFLIFLFLNIPFNSSVPNAPFPYPLKTENLMVFSCFQGVEKGGIGNKWVQRMSTLPHPHQSLYLVIIQKPITYITKIFI